MATPIDSVVLKCRKN